MLLVTSDADFDLGAGVMVRAGERVVVPDDCARRMAAAAAKDGSVHVRVSGLGNYTRRYCGQDLFRKRLLVWRGHGVGDQLMAAGLIAIIQGRELRPQIDFLCHPKLCRALWDGVDGLPFRAVPEPLPFDEWQAYDYHLVLEDLVECDAEPDQVNAWDSMLDIAGFDPDLVPASMKRPIVPLREVDGRDALNWLGGSGAQFLVRPLVLWQAAASSRIRSYPPEETRRALELCVAARPDVTWLVTGTPAQLAQYAPLPQGVCSGAAPRLRVLFAAVERAALCVCPDSVMGHVCGGLQVPCVSLWASFLPQDRVSTYGVHRPLVGRAECAPCRLHECADQPEGCPRSADGWCAGLRSISPEAVADAVLLALADGRKG